MTKSDKWKVVWLIVWLVVSSFWGIAMAGQLVPHGKTAPPEGLQARKIRAANAAFASDQPGTSGKAFRQFVAKLAATGYRPIPTHPEQLIGRLPSIIAYVQGLLDAQDAKLAAKLTEVEAHANAGEFRKGFADQLIWNNLMRQRCQIQDSYNEIQSWALTMLIRRAANK